MKEEWPFWHFVVFVLITIYLFLLKEKPSKKFLHILMLFIMPFILTNMMSLI